MQFPDGLPEIPEERDFFFFDNSPLNPASAFADQRASCGRATETTAEELSALNDEDLVMTVYARQEAAIDDDPERLDELSPAGQAVYVVYCFDLEAQNGGLSQFFTNSSGVLYPRVAASLRAVGADWAADLLEETCGGLDLGSDPGETVMEMDDEELEPLDAFDHAYYDGCEVRSVWDDLAAFVRRNLDQL